MCCSDVASGAVGAAGLPGGAPAGPPAGAPAGVPAGAAGEDGVLRTPSGFAVNDPSKPLSQWSWTIGCNGAHVRRTWLERIKSCWARYDIRGSASLEKGGKNNTLHIQAACEMHLPTDTDTQAKLRVALREHIPIVPGDNAKLNCKPLADGQALLEMMGYCQKDQGLPHYAMVKWKVSDEEAEEARKVYANVAADYLKGRIKLSRNSFHERIHAFRHSNCYPFACPVDIVLFHMIRTTRFCPDSGWITLVGGRPAGVHATCAWMAIVCRPQDVARCSMCRFFFWPAQYEDVCAVFHWHHFHVQLHGACGHA